MGGGEDFLDSADSRLCFQEIEAGKWRVIYEFTISRFTQPIEACQERKVNAEKGWNS